MRVIFIESLNDLRRVGPLFVARPSPHEKVESHYDHSEAHAPRCSDSRPTAYLAAVTSGSSVPDPGIVPRPTVRAIYNPPLSFLGPGGDRFGVG